MGMTRRALLASSAAMALLGAAGSAIAQAKRPNIVVILADDVGYSDFSSYGGEIPTPNIDALGAGGLKFTQFYNCARCSPSRASLLTGAWPHQAGLGHLEQFAIPESAGIRGALMNRVVTFAELLKDAGYFTAMAGKWHLGISRGVGPWNRGFDRSCASPQGRMYFPDMTTNNPVNKDIYIDGKLFDISAPQVGKGQWYSADLFVDYGIRYIHEARRQKKPFVFYLPFVNAHAPLMAPKEDIARFKGRYMAGWDAVRQARFERQKALGILGPDQILPPREPNTYNWDKLTPKEKDDFDTIMAIYAANVARMDKAIGTLVSALKSMGEIDNTLILFMSDIGGNAEAGPDGELEGKIPGSPDSYVAAGMEWATLQNTPFRYFKHFVGEGGISTPLVVHWPNGIDRSRNGSYVKEMGHLVDVMPTLLEVTGVQYPKTYKGQELVPLQGQSFAPTFRMTSWNRSGPLFFEHEGNRAIRSGQWKLVQNWGQQWCLYDMTTDRSETRDIAASRPDLVYSLAAQWNIWASRSFMDPWTTEINKMIFPKAPRQNWAGAGIPKLPHAMDAAAKWP